jgi:hypothetical protein
MVVASPSRPSHASTVALCAPCARSPVGRGHRGRVTVAERPRLYMVAVGPAWPSQSLGPRALAPPSTSSSRLSHAVALAAGTYHDRSSQRPSRSTYRTAATSSHPRIAPARTPTSHCEVGTMSSLVKTDITRLPLRMAPARRDSQNRTWTTTPKPHSCSAHSRSLARSPSSKTMFVYPRMCLSTPLLYTLYNVIYSLFCVWIASPLYHSQCRVVVLR